MNTVKIYRLTHLSPTLFGRLKTAQMEATQVWNYCYELHKAARTTHGTWPGQNELQQATKGQFALHSQTVQMVVHAFLTTIETTQMLRATHSKMRMKYSLMTKHFYPVRWPAQAVSRECGRVVLPMWRGHASIVLHLPEHSRVCTLVWNNGFAGQGGVNDHKK
jgi:putative transposase